MNGCYNRQPFQPTTLVQDGWIIANQTRFPRMVGIPFRMSQTCNYSKDPKGYGQQDPNCTGCQHKEAA